MLVTPNPCRYPDMNSSSIFHEIRVKSPHQHLLYTPLISSRNKRLLLQSDAKIVAQKNSDCKRNIVMDIAKHKIPPSTKLYFHIILTFFDLRKIEYLLMQW